MSGKTIGALFFSLLLTAAFAGGSGITLYEDPGFSGASRIIERDIDDLAANQPFADTIGSIQIPRGWWVVLFEAPHFRGKSVVLDQSEPGLGAYRLGFERPGSLRVVWDQSYAPDLPGGRDQGVTLFSETNYQGDYEIFSDSISDLKGSFLGNDRASSVWVPSGYSVTLYQHKNYKGRSLTLTRGAPDLGLTPIDEFQVSSLWILREDAPPPPVVRGPARWEPYLALAVHLEDDDVEDVLAVAAGALIVAGIVKAVKKSRKVPGPGVTLYEGINFSGKRETLNRNFRRMKKTRLGNDSVRSVEVPPGYEVVLYEHDGFRGDSVVLKESVEDLSRTKVGAGKVSSMRIRWVGR